MTYKGETIIGRPSLALVEIYIAERGLLCEAQDCYDYWEKKNWLTQKKVEPKTLESAISSYNSIVIQKFVQRNQKLLGIPKGNKRERKKAKKKARKDILNGKIVIKKQEAKLIRQKSVSTPHTKKFMPYDEQLKDKKWLAFRKSVFKVHGKKCELCGNTHHLQIHHPKYKYGHLAWEYKYNEVMVVCGDCHMKIHKIT